METVLCDFSINSINNNYNCDYQQALLRNPRFNFGINNSQTLKRPIIIQPYWAVFTHTTVHDQNQYWLSWWMSKDNEKQPTALIFKPGQIIEKSLCKYIIFTVNANTPFHSLISNRNASTIHLDVLAVVVWDHWFFIIILFKSMYGTYSKWLWQLSFLYLNPI